MTSTTAEQRVDAAVSSGRTLLTFGGVETFLLYQQQFPLREFCAFEVLDDEPAWRALESGFLRPIMDAAVEGGFGILTDSFAWRASADWVLKTDHSRDDVRRFNQAGVRSVRAVVDEYRASASPSSSFPVLLAADVGPRGDGYDVAGGPPPIEAAFEYHVEQLRALAECDVDLAVALTMTSANEAIGIVRAAREFRLPVVVSPTVEVDGSVPEGRSMRDFVSMVDDETAGYPSFYMINCAHPTHVEPTLRAAADKGHPWLERFRGIRVNASAKSHEELDRSTELDAGDPRELAALVARMQRRYGLTVLGGCCGTDANHIRAIGAALNEGSHRTAG